MKRFTVIQEFVVLVSFLSLFGCTNVSAPDDSLADTVEATLMPTLVLTPHPILTPTSTFIVPATSYPDPLDGSSWELLAFDGDENAPGISEPSPFTVHFKGGVVYLDAGCNSVSGHYILENERITITFAFRTEVACTPPIINTVEIAFADAMATFDSYTIEEDGILRIRYADGELLLRQTNDTTSEDENQAQRLSDLAGTRWQLLSMSDQNLFAEAPITLNISSGALGGSSGCNSYSANYQTASGNHFEVTIIEMTLMLCIEPEGIMELEEQYLSRLREATKYRQEGNELSLIDSQDQVLLEFRQIPTYDVQPHQLVGNEWQLVSADGIEESNLSAFTIRFDQGVFVGTTSCRDYEGEYQANADRFVITYLSMTTNVDCSENALLAEAEYTTLLGSVVQYNIVKTRLELYTQKNEQLIFERVFE
ncbi:MAG: META domain-containing protein [Anaerolineales bacterium]|nr:META domain-containing protein [Anaerolineales bacterium]